LKVRPETTSDHAAIAQINDLAFGGPGESRLVAGLRQLAGTLSFVAEVDDAPVGHIMFSQASVLNPQTGTSLPVMILAPMAVLPGWQRQRVGSLLVQHGLQACRQAGHRLVVVLGHPAYYPRFGFVPAGPRGIQYPQPVPAEVFMLLELVAHAAAGVQGVLQLPGPFSYVS
jgi:putative acetyltransferase